MTAVGVFCGWRRQQDAPAAFVVGRALADAGFDLVYGGDTRGAMGGVAAGAKAGGATVYGILLQRWIAECALPADEKVFAVPTLGQRATALYDASDAFLILAGGKGTLRELLDVWDSKTNGEHNKPIVILDPSYHWSPLVRQIVNMIEDGYCGPDELQAVHRVTGVAEAINSLRGQLDALRRLS